MSGCWTAFRIVHPRSPRASRLARLLFLFAGGLVCAALGGCTSLFLYPDRARHFADHDLGTPTQDVWLTARDGSALHALYLPAQGTPRATVLFLHGNAQNVSAHVYAVRWLPARGYNVLALDYRGYGRSQGEADVDAVHEDADTALDWLAAGGAGTTGPLIVYGQSLGGSVAIRAVACSASRQRVAAVIADSAFSSYRGIAREKLAGVWLTWPLQWPLSLLISDRYAAIDVVDRISPIPLLLIHGERDVVVDASHSRRLYAAAREPKDLWLIPEGVHTDAVSRDTVRERLADFMDLAVERARGIRKPAQAGPMRDRRDTIEPCRWPASEFIERDSW